MLEDTIDENLDSLRLYYQGDHYKNMQCEYYANIKGVENSHLCIKEIQRFLARYECFCNADLIY